MSREYCEWPLPCPGAGPCNPGCRHYCSRLSSSAILGLKVCGQHNRVARARIQEEVAWDQELSDWWRSRAEANAAAARAELLDTPYQGPHTIYFAERHAFVKIGYATDLRKRLASITAGSCIIPGMAAGPVKLLAAMPGGPRLESRLHEHFRHIRVKGEWFLGNDEMEAFVVEVQSRHGPPLWRLEARRAS